MHSSSRLWIAEPQSPEARGAELDALCRRIERRERLELVVTCAACLFFSGVGALLLGYSMAMTHPTWAPIAFWSGLGIGYGGVLLTLTEAFRRRMEREG